MLCSRCSANVKPIVSVDIDGTIADYHDTLARFVIDYWALNEPNGFFREGPWDGSGNFEDYLGISQAQYREAKLAFRQGGMKRVMPLFTGVKYQLSRLREQGADIWFCTTRPWKRLDNVDPDTKFWLERHDLQFEGLLFGEDKYGDLLEAVDAERIVMVIDDLPEQVDRARELGLPAVQVAAPHNSHESQMREGRYSLLSCFQLTEEEIRHWYTRKGRRNGRS